MSKENEARVSTEDARNVAESLFGDAADHAADAGGEDENASKEAVQAPQGSEVDEHQVAGEETGSPEDLKVVVSVREGRVTIGVQRPSSDPYMESFDDREVSELAQEVPVVLERARARWEDAPKHPAYERPTPSTGRRPRREQPPAQNPTAEGEAVEQQPETLRLF